MITFFRGPKMLFNLSKNLNKLSKKYQWYSKLRKLDAFGQKYACVSTIYTYDDNCQKEGFHTHSLLMLRHFPFATVLPIVKIVRFLNSECSSSHGHHGTCYNEKECHEAGGEPQGTCANGFGVCCVGEYMKWLRRPRNSYYFECHATVQPLRNWGAVTCMLGDHVPCSNKEFIL